MKKFLVVILAAAFLFSMCSCSEESEEDFHFDLIREYQNVNGEKYYKNTVGGVEILDFGVRYNAYLYDIENSKDNMLTYFYKYEGQTAKTKGLADMNDYNKYLADTFGGSLDDKAWKYLTESGDIIWVSYVDLSVNAVGLIVSVSIPTNGIVGKEKDYTIVSDSSSASDN